MDDGTVGVDSVKISGKGPIMRPRVHGSTVSGEKIGLACIRHLMYPLESRTLKA